jgi:hypothetical protein
VPGSPNGGGPNGSLKGLLATQCIEKTFDVAGPNSPTAQGPNSAVNIWYHSPISIQMVWPTAEMGGRARTITGFFWVLGVPFTRTYPNLTIRMGHANDLVDAQGFAGLVYSGSNFGDFPVQVVPTTTYRTSPAIITGDFVRGPDFLENFNYNGQEGLMMDLVHNGDPASNNAWERWRADINYPIQCATYLIGTTPGAANKWLFTTRFRYLTPGAEAQSQFYDIGRSNARTLPQQVVPTTQPAGTSVVFQWQGAREDTINPSIPDLSTLTPWFSDIRQLASYRYIRFRATLNNNTIARTSPSVDILSMPYVFK